MGTADAAYGWVDDVTDDHLLSLLAEHGTDVGALVQGVGDDAAGSDDDQDRWQVVPLRDGWLRIGPDDAGVLVARWIDHPGRPAAVRDDRPPIVLDEVGADDLDGWIRTRADIDGACRRWLYVLRRPEREAYAALLYEAGPDGPVRRRVVAGIYPDITLCDDDAGLVAFVEADRGQRELTRAVLEPLVGDVDRADGSPARTVLRDSTSGGLAVQACSVRRFVKLSHGVRTLRVWDLVDVAATRPAPIQVPGVPSDPDLFDVALLDGEAVLTQLVNGDGFWELTVSVIDSGEILHGWRAATGLGTALEVVCGDGSALVRVREQAEERLLRVALDGFSADATAALRTTSGLFNLAANTTTPSAGWSAVELSGGSDPYSWYWDGDGRPLRGPLGQGPNATPVNRSVELVHADDGCPVEVDLRWRGDPALGFRGPVLLMVYGAYGMNIDLDADRDLGRWLDRGFAVGTPHVRGGGPAARHLAGCRSNRDRSLADLTATVRALRTGLGPVTATRTAVLGASAGGFLAATALNTCPDEVDACVVVNGFVDPLTSLLRRDTATTASDQDEWGDPLQNLNDLQTLTEISPVGNLTTAGSARALVVVAARDARVNPRQGLKWFLTYRSLGGDATLWFDPLGAHDCWGAGMDPGALVDWVCDAVGLG